MKIDQCVKGRRYKVRYRLGMQRLAREAVMIFLDAGAVLNWPRTSTWSARPVAGTQELPVDSIISIEEVAPGTEVYLNRVVRA